MHYLLLLLAYLMVIQTVFSTVLNGNPASDLARQPSLYSLTLEEIQTAMNEPGKAFGSMNMEDFMKNLWTSEETQATVSTENHHLPQQSLQRLNILSLPPSLSRKTVDDVWRDIQRQPPADLTDGQRHRPNQQKSQLTFGEMTLEDFLSKAGAFVDDPDASSHLADGGNAMSLYSAGVPSANRVSTNLPASNDPLTPLPSPSLQNDWMHFTTHHQHQQMLQQAEAAAAAVKRGLAPQALITPSVKSSLYDGLANSSGLFQETTFQNTLALSPSAVHGRKRSTAEVLIEKTMERRQKRMIKNRESAARSRARKQAYTDELEAEIFRLKEENSSLKLQQVLESRLPETFSSQGEKVHVLRRVRSW